MGSEVMAMWDPGIRGVTRWVSGLARVALCAAVALASTAAGDEFSRSGDQDMLVVRAPAGSEREAEWSESRASGLGSIARVSHGVIFDPRRLPGRLAAERLGPIWQSGTELERRELFVASAARYEVIVTQVPEQAYTYWRIARNYWRQGETLPVEAQEERLRYFELAEQWSERGLSTDPDCGACMLWKFVSLGRQATTRGLLSAVPDAREMDRLLRRAIELQPAHRDNPGNSTLGNLYYAASVFYRIVPDWWWLRVFVGIRGDKERAVDYARRAVESSRVRVDYRIELGASLLCLGRDRDQPERLTEGIVVLREALKLPDYLSTDAVDRRHAQILLEAPHRACGYSRDGFIDLDALGQQARSGRGPGDRPG